MSCSDEDVNPNDVITPHDGDTPSDLGRISSDLLSQENELNELKQELKDVTEAFDAFQKDYSQLLSQYNETNDELQSLLHERSMEGAALAGESAAEMTASLAAEEKYRQVEVERDKYREMYLEVVESRGAPTAPRTTADEQTSPADTAELHDQIRDMSARIQELEMIREERSLLLQQQAGEKAELLDELGRVKQALEQMESDNIDAVNAANFSKEQLAVKNKVIEKLRTEFTELGDDNTRLRAEASKYRDLHENQEELLTTANVNQEDLNKDYQALQYRCSETERREQEALLYIKDCLKLVEQTQHEKEQIVIQAAQSENMRLEIEGTLATLVEEASRRTLEEVDKIKEESNRNIELLISDCSAHQERIAELEAEIEEGNRERELRQLSPVNGVDAVQIADRDAVIAKLREHVNKLEADKLNLTDQLLEVSNTMRLSKEHFETKLRSLECHLSTTKEKLSRSQREKESLRNDCTRSAEELEETKGNQRALKNSIQQLKTGLESTEKQNSEQLRELMREEELKREDLKKGHNKLIDNLRRDLLEKQNQISRLQEIDSQTRYCLSNKENEQKIQIVSLSKKLKEMTHLHADSLSKLEKLRSAEEQQREKVFRTETRLKAVDMQLNSANNQIAVVTESEAKLSSKVKELQLRINELEFSLERSKTSPIKTSNVLGSLKIPATPVNHHAPTKLRSERKRDKRDKKEKEQITNIFSSQLRSRDRNRKVTSTPNSNKSDVTIKFVEKMDPSSDDEISVIKDGGDT